MLHGIGWYLVTVSGQPIDSIFKGQAVQLSTYNTYYPRRTKASTTLWQKLEISQVMVCDIYSKSLENSGLEWEVG